MAITWPLERKQVSNTFFGVKNMSRSSPWGKVDHITQIMRGFSFVSTPGHGGAMIAIGFANNHLSLSARNRGDKWGGYLCYEEDCLYAIPFYELLKKFPELLPKMYNPSSTVGLEQRMVQLKNTLSAWNPTYLLEVGEIPSEPQYSHWKEWQENDRLRQSKDPDFIVAALNVAEGITQVWTADERTHFVAADSYQNGTVVDLLSKCTLVEPYALEALLAEPVALAKGLGNKDRWAIEEYLKQACIAGDKR
jgi:hypothetical protein